MVLWLKISLYVLSGAAVLAVLIAAVRCGKPLRRLTGGALQGLCALGAVDLVGAFTGVSLGIGWFSAAVCAVMGIPGVIAMLMLKLVFAV